MDYGEEKIMSRSTSVRVFLLSIATFSLVVAGGGVAAAVPVRTPDTQEEGVIAVGGNPESEYWNCLLVGSALEAGPRIDTATTGESRGGFAPGSTVGALCTGSGLATATGVTSLDDAD
ncbi:hypothetical protein ACTD5D_25510 [Nocardia takedensis]|uniref:hypothetical protein n=1 Tax=Nocardia takedensis TaxID=259390 RepID=UPI000593B8CB|nr:hypothetical protein [Nocardia takedensis]